jgi:peptide/nickel transport system substrate-binding protein
VEDKIHLQAGFSGWLSDTSTPAGFLDTSLTCRSYQVKSYPSQNQNFAEFCDPTIDREIARAESLHVTDPQTASRLWAKVDRDITDKAPWVTFANGVVVEAISTRVGNYQHSPQWGTLLDQLWVR